MRKAMTLGLVLAVLFGTLAWAAYAMSDKTHGEKESASRSRYHQAMQDVKIEVANTDKGVIVVITSDKPEVVKMIQGRWAKRQEVHESGNPGPGPKEGSDESQGKHMGGMMGMMGMMRKHGAAENHDEGECKEGEQMSDKCPGHEPDQE